MKPTLKQIKKIMAEKAYKYFHGGDYDVNIIGVRNTETAGVLTNKFDDWITLSYTIDGKEYYECWEATTDPGESWMDSPLSEKGCAILVPGQYRGVYKIAKHGGRYEALCQRWGKVRVYRVSNRDECYDTDDATIQEGYYGINIHRSNPKRPSKQINKYSAGCQVFACPDDFDDFMDVCNKAADKWGNKFTYTLIEI